MKQQPANRHRARFRRRPLLHCVFALCFGLLGSITIATGAEQAETSSEDAAEDTADEGAANSDVFIPSEDISEDLAVPFPVDI